MEDDQLFETFLLKHRGSFQIYVPSTTHRSYFENKLGIIFEVWVSMNVYFLRLYALQMEKIAQQHGLFKFLINTIIIIESLKPW
jgi:hypothetical protein